MSSSNVKDLVVGFVNFIDQASENSSIVASESAESLETFDISEEYTPKNIDFNKTSLIEIFSNYLDTNKSTSAEEFKAKGNSFMATRDYQSAVEQYSKAIDLDKTNSIYFANRSAAYCQLNKFEEAQTDAQTAVDIDPSYAKAYSRLGHACFGAGNFTDAAEAYQEALKLDPSNQATKSFLQAAQSKLDAQITTDSTRGMNSGGPGGAASMPDLSSLLNNPALASMAQNLMSSGAMDQMLKNPEIAKMADSFKSSGKMPNMNDIMSNPALKEMAGNLGAGASPSPAAASGANPNSADPLSSLLNNPQLMEMASKFMQPPKK
ncbi:hypothetical protein BB561_001827 [Smittium simulii]|uniref:Uncharacterized protein n=1 Tax=Smittium simulii TaxID=133385 RepID=A0A2T9YST5_9FUNG|nr:hypothetical protein BB561_001827 [Smittium simulii]